MDKSKKKSIIVSVTSDLVSDNRVHKFSTTLCNMGFNVLVVGRKLPDSLPVESRPYQTKRFILPFTKGFLFYGFYNIRLFLFLIFSKYDFLLSNDLDTLPANFAASKIKNKPLVYDCHEYFTEVPELINRQSVKKIWEWLEKKMVPNIKFAITVCNSIALIYKDKYGTQFKVVRNMPVAGSFEPNTEKIENQQKVILYQGAVNIGRGLEQVILAMHFIDDAKLVIAGRGDILDKLLNLVARENLQHKVDFTGRLSLEELRKLTPIADLGLSVEEDLGLNYRYALPNKLFDYIQARVPVLVTDLPEMSAIVNHYQIGEITKSLEPKHLSEKIKDALNNHEKRNLWKKNLIKAASELTWENEENVIEDVFSPFLQTRKSTKS